MNPLTPQIVDKVKDGKKVLCAFCKQPIHISHFAGVMKGKHGEELFFCDSLPCLLEMNNMMEFTKESEQL